MAEVSIVRAGSDLLFRVLIQSTIGVTVFHCRVRDGIECFNRAITTGSNNTNMGFRKSIFMKPVYSRMRIIYTQNEQDNQAISTDRLRTLQCFNPRPIDVVVFHGLNGDTLF